MNERVVFDSRESRDLFFKKVRDSLNLKFWKNFRLHFNLSRTMFDLYRSGKISLPFEIYKKFLNILPAKDKKFFHQKINLIDSNWGRVKGGKAAFQKNKTYFDQGRKKAIGVVMDKAEKRINLNISLTPRLAYFIGLLIGDGFTNKYGRYYLIQFTGDLREEEFYRNLFSEYSKNLFNIVPKIKFDKYSNAIRVNFYSKALFNLITKRFKISAGRKSHNVLIPDEILNSSEEILLSCIKGIYDAEGCVFLDKRDKYSKPYPRIELHMCNLGILKQIHEILKVAGIPSTLGTYHKNLRVTIYNEENVRKFIKKIGFNNAKQLKKLKEAKLI